RDSRIGPEDRGRFRGAAAATESAARRAAEAVPREEPEDALAFGRRRARRDRIGDGPRARRRRAARRLAAGTSAVEAGDSSDGRAAGWRRRGRLRRVETEAGICASGDAILVPAPRGAGILEYRPLVRGVVARRVEPGVRRELSVVPAADVGL